MHVRGVTKAAVPPVSAVVASVVLALSLAQSTPTARKTEPIQDAKPLQAIIQEIPAPPAEHEAAGRKVRAQVAAPTSTYLAIVNQPNIHENQKILADAVLRRLPALCRNNLKNFYVLYQGASNRGLGGKTTIIIDGTTPDNEFVGLLVHECGHVIHGNLLGSLRTGKSAFKDGKDVFAKDAPAASFFAISWMTADVAKAEDTKQDFVTGYAETNAFEDFAETFATYILQRPSMVERAKTNTAIAAKLAWMETNLPVSDTLLGTPLYVWDKKVPWDATKLSFIWAPQAS